jgi:hypothetical protein
MARSALLALPLVCTLAILPGCWVPGSNQFSTDSYTYQSTAHLPQTVTVVDTRNGQPVFSVDIPVGKQLVMQFHRGAGTKLADGEPSDLYPDKLKWDLWPMGRQFGWPTQELDCPDRYSRRVDVTLREGPELADSLKPVVTTPAPQGDPTVTPMPANPPMVPAPQDKPSVPAPVAPPGPGKPVISGDGQG